MLNKYKYAAAEPLNKSSSDQDSKKAKKASVVKVGRRGETTPEENSVTLAQGK